MTLQCLPPRWGGHLFLEAEFSPLGHRFFTGTQLGRRPDGDSYQAV